MLCESVLDPDNFPTVYEAVNGRSKSTRRNSDKLIGEKKKFYNFTRASSIAGNCMIGARASHVLLSTSFNCKRINNEFD